MTESSTSGTTCDKCDATFPEGEYHVCNSFPIKTRTMAQAFNEWMRRYTDEPERFAADFRTCGEFLAETARGEEPTYGETCATYLANLMVEEVPFVESAMSGTYMGGPDGVTVYGAHGVAIKIGDPVLVGEKLTIKVASDDGGHEVALL